jgi:4-hydroxybenzoate polyprenyltransferase
VTRSLPMQVLGAAVFLGIIAAAAIILSDGWADYLVFAAFFLTFLGFAIAINHRQYPTKKRGFQRSSEDPPKKPLL